MMRSSSRTIVRGFTLVELAVSMTVIGILIGGILRGQELISSAKARNVIDQKNGIQTAILAFSSRYKATAGDLDAAQVAFIGSDVKASKKGFGDGLIRLTHNDATIDESVLVFQNLTATGFLLCNACMAAAGNDVASRFNSPLNTNASYMEFGTVAPTSAGSTAASPWWFDTLAVAPSARNILTTGALLGSILAQIDLKADDGMPHTGAFRQSSGSGADTTLNCTTITAAGPPAVYAWTTNTGNGNCAGAWLF
jgi:prepilin-type N-terminal cleavage/methylation domain-containing protein